MLQNKKITKQISKNNAYLFLFLLSMLPIEMFADPGFPFGGDPGEPPVENPIDTPYFWALLFVLGVYIAYKKLHIYSNHCKLDK